MYSLIRVNKENQLYASKFLNNNLENVYVINGNNKNFGIVEVKENEGVCKIELIEVEKQFKKKGIGRDVIKTLLGLHEVVYGDSLPRKESIGFWQSLGAEFEEDIEECIENGDCIPFIIYQN